MACTESTWNDKEDREYSEDREDREWKREKERKRRRDEMRGKRERRAESEVSNDDRSRSINIIYQYLLVELSVTEASQVLSPNSSYYQINHLMKYR